MNIFYLIMQQMFILSIPLLIVALGAMVSERSGVVNIALEGIMLFGAFFGILTINIIQSGLPKELFNSVSYEQLVLIIGILVGGVAGLLFSLFHAYASINMKANQIISGTALNMFAPAFGLFLAPVLAATGHTQQITFAKTAFLIRNVPVLGNIPFIGDIFFKQVFLTTYYGFIILFLIYLFIFKTRFGLRLRSCGEHPQASDAAGINVFKMRYIGVAISGLLAGIGGVIFISTTSTEYNSTVSGYGFLALAVLIFGQWKPMRILLAALFFGFMNAVASLESVIPFLDKLNLPTYFYKMVPYLTTIVILAFTSASTQAPKAEGEVYDPGKR